MREGVAERERVGARPVVIAAGARAALIVGLASAIALLVSTPRNEGEALSGELRAWVLEDGAARPLEDGDAVPPGARVQLAYVAVESPAPPLALHAVVFSVDDEGRRTLHYPRHEDAATVVERASGVLPTALELDDTPGAERFYLVLAPRPLSVTAVLRSEPSAKYSLLLRKSSRAPRAGEVR